MHIWVDKVLEADAKGIRLKWKRITMHEGVQFILLEVGTTDRNLDFVVFHDGLGCKMEGRWVCLEQCSKPVRSEGVATHVEVTARSQ